MRERISSTLIRACTLMMPVIVAFIVLLIVASVASAALPKKQEAETGPTQTVGAPHTDSTSTPSAASPNAYRLTGNGGIRFFFNVDAGDTVNSIVVRAKLGGTSVSAANLVVVADGVNLGTKTLTLSNTTYAEYSFATNLSAGQHTIDVYAQDMQTGDRMIWDWVELRGTNTTPDPDSDGDGVPDSTDNCDTQPGPASNQGCPVQTGNTWSWNADNASVTVAPGDNAVSKINNAPAGAVVKVLAGTYNLGAELQPASNVKLRAEPGTYTLVAGKGYQVDPAVTFNVTHAGDNGMRAAPGLEVRGFELRGVDPPFTDTGSGSCAGKGSFIAGGPGNGTELYEYNEFHDNAAVAISNVQGRVLRNEGYNNTTNLEFLGCNAGTFKGSVEFEAGYNFVHDEEGNGIWCDNGCENEPLRGANGAWFHDNVVVNTGSAGIRAEELPDLNPNRPNPGDISVLIENNVIGGSSLRTGRADIHVHDSANVTVRTNQVGVSSVTGFGAVQNTPNDNGLRASDSCRTDRPDLGRPLYGPVRFTNNDLNGSRILVEQSRYQAGDVILSGNTEVLRVDTEGGASCG